MTSKPDWTFDHPHPDHRPRVSRRNRGSSRVRGMGTTSGTNLRCACGWEWFTNNYAPSKGGMKDAKAAYADHLTTALLPDYVRLRLALEEIDRSGWTTRQKIAGYRAEYAEWRATIDRIARKRARYEQWLADRAATTERTPS